MKGMDWNMEHAVELHLRLEQDLLRLRDGRMMLLVLLLQLLLLLWLSLLLLRLLLLLLWQQPHEVNDLGSIAQLYTRPIMDAHVQASTHMQKYRHISPSINNTCMAT